MTQFLAPVLTLTGLGIFFALVLSWASKKFAVAQDPRIAQVLEKLPGANCGACGMAGCARFAESVVKGEVALESCKACSQEAHSEIAQLLGIELAKTEKKIALLHCHGGEKAKEKFEYKGIEQCQAAAQLMGGNKLCSYACLGFGDCMRACPFGAITMSKEGLPVIDKELCTACGKCIQACPRNLIKLIPYKAEVYVGCASRDPAKTVAKICSVGCIACKKCEKVCPADAIKVVENLAIIDYDKCTSCGKCLEACPRKIIKRSHGLGSDSERKPAG
ncbi:MAG: Fe-S cluster domain-containing protein [Candidatus Omnitrophica bacterium]|nr:Fe-S cluster domain-containing protein [Candidatus Omnitrophota bacterium]